MMIFDKLKIQHKMIDGGIGSFDELARKASISPTTLYNTMGSGKWRSATVSAVAKAIGCNPLDLITVKEEGEVE